jgi:hypothetical protein
MYLSDRDLRFAVEPGQLIVDPKPEEYDTTSIDLHLDGITEAKVWNVKAFAAEQKQSGNEPVLGVGTFDHEAFSKKFHMALPDENDIRDIEERKSISPGLSERRHGNSKTRWILLVANSGKRRHA